MITSSSSMCSTMSTAGEPSQADETAQGQQAFKRLMKKSDFWRLEKHSDVIIKLLTSGDEGVELDVIPGHAVIIQQRSEVLSMLIDQAPDPAPPARAKVIQLHIARKQLPAAQLALKSMYISTSLPPDIAHDLTMGVMLGDMWGMPSHVKSCLNKLHEVVSTLEDVCQVLAEPAYTVIKAYPEEHQLIQAKCRSVLLSRFKSSDYLVAADYLVVAWTKYALDRDLYDPSDDLESGSDYKGSDQGSDEGGSDEQQIDEGEWELEPEEAQAEDDGQVKCISDSTAEMFLCLPVQAVMLLVGSDDMVCFSESSFAVLISLWWHHNAPPDDQTKQEWQQALTSVVRVVHIPLSFLQPLPWFSASDTALDIVSSIKDMQAFDAGGFTLPILPDCVPRCWFGHNRSSACVDNVHVYDLKSLLENDAGLGTMLDGQLWGLSASVQCDAESKKKIVCVKVTRCPMAFFIPIPPWHPVKLRLTHDMHSTDCSILVAASAEHSFSIEDVDDELISITLLSVYSSPVTRKVA